MNGFTKFINELSFKQLLIWIIVVIIIIAAIVWGINYVEKKADDREEEKKKEEQEKDTDAKQTAKDEIIESSLTFSESEYIQMADKMATAFVYEWGTDENPIYEVFDKLKSKSDFLKVVDKFGVRTLESTMYPWPFNMQTGNLYQFLATELDSEEKTEANIHLAKTGVTI